MLRITVVFMFLVCSVSYAAMPDELVLYMSFDKSTVADKTVTDLSKYGNNGIIMGAPKVATGHKGDALTFNGASESCSDTNLSKPCKNYKPDITRGMDQSQYRWTNRGCHQMGWSLKWYVPL